MNAQTITPGMPEPEKDGIYLIGVQCSNDSIILIHDTSYAEPSWHDVAAQIWRDWRNIAFIYDGAIIESFADRDARIRREALTTPFDMKKVATYRPRKVETTNPAPPETSSIDVDHLLSFGLCSPACLCARNDIQECNCACQGKFHGRLRYSEFQSDSITDNTTSHMNNHKTRRSRSGNAMDHSNIEKARRRIMNYFTHGSNKRRTLKGYQVSQQISRNCRRCAYLALAELRASGELSIVGADTGKESSNTWELAEEHGQSMRYEHEGKAHRHESDQSLISYPLPDNDGN